MNWKILIAILATVGLALVAGVWVGSCRGQQRFLERDAERAAQVALLLKEAAQRGEDAATAIEQSQEAEARMDTALEEKAALEAKLNALRANVRKRPVATNAGELRARLDEAGDLNTMLEEDLEITDTALFACTDSLGSCRAASAALSQQVTAIHGAHTIQTERLSSWKKQTKRGRVKTAFLGIGMAAAGVGIGYMIRAVTEPDPAPPQQQGGAVIAWGGL